MPNCVVKGCSSNSTNPHYDESGRKVTLHQFPTKVTRAEWISILRERGGRSPAWEPNANAKICSMHFDEADIDRTGQCVRIKAYAVPVYFSSLKRKSRKRHSEEAADAPTWAQQPPPSLIPIGKIDAAPFQPAPPQPPVAIIKEDKPSAATAAPPAAMVLVPVSTPAPALTPVPPLVPVSKAMASPAREPSTSPPVKLMLEVQTSSAVPPLTMVSKEVSVAAAPTSSVRSVHLLATKATLEPISSPILGSIMRGTPLTKREQMLNSPAVTSTLVEKCIRRSKKFQV
jgi:THAP domain